MADGKPPLRFPPELRAALAASASPRHGRIGAPSHAKRGGGSDAGEPGGPRLAARSATLRMPPSPPQRPFQSPQPLGPIQALPLHRWGRSAGRCRARVEQWGKGGAWPPVRSSGPGPRFLPPPSQALAKINTEMPKQAKQTAGMFKFRCRCGEHQ